MSMASISTVDDNFWRIQPSEDDGSALKALGKVSVVLALDFNAVNGGRES
jgi:hypothetical protein